MFFIATKNVYSSELWRLFFGVVGVLFFFLFCWPPLLSETSVKLGTRITRRVILLCFEGT